MTQPTYYDILGISLSADTEIIDAAYHALTKKYKNNPNATHRLVQIRQAYETLSDPIKRADYDSWLQMNARFSQTAPPAFGTQTTHSPIQTTDDYRPHEPPKPKKSSLTSWLVGLLIAMIAVVILAYFLVSSAGFFGHRDEPVTPLNHDTPNSSIPKLVAIEPMIPFTPDEITPEQQASYEHAHAAYLAAVNRINAVWNNLPKTIQDELRDEQRHINSTREEICKAQAASQYSHPTDIDTARYQCEVPRLDERTEILRIYAANVADQPTLFYDPSYSNQPTYSDHSKHLEDYTPSEAHALYDDAVAHINAVWNELSDETQSLLRDEQRAINADRERYCQVNAQNTYNNRHDQTVARYLCEVALLYERAEELALYD